MKRNLYLPVCIVFIIGIAVTSFAQSSTTRIITTYAGNGLAGYDGDNGVATMAKLHAPSTIAMDGAGNLYINDQLNNCIRKVDASGIITTVAGTGVAGKGADGVPATSSALNDNWGVAADNAGNIYITEQGSYRVRKVTAAGIITTIAGTGVQGFSGDGSAATNAKMQSPEGIAVDGAGNVYIGDPSNYRVRRVDPSGIITTIAGNGTQGNSGDGNPANSAQIGYFWGLATDGGGNLYICDGDNNCIRKVNTAGIISTIAGTGSAGYTGDGIEATNATLNQPRGVYVNSSGEVFIADYLNHCIRKISASGIISTVAGTGMAARPPRPSYPTRYL
jgi:trimeric autotransporter adhesin